MKLWCSVAVLITISVTVVAAFSAGGPPQQASPVPGNRSADQTVPLPKDVYPDALSRLPLVKRENMDEKGRKLYDLFSSPQGGRPPVGLRGPYGIWPHSPPVGELAQPLNRYLRYETGLDRRVTELAILVTARQLDKQYEWTSHEPIALKEGLEPHIIDFVKYRKGLAGLGEKEALIISFGRELFGKKKVSSQTFAHALKVFGEQGVVDLAALMGDYSSVSAIINSFDIQLPPDKKPLLPMP